MPCRCRMKNIIVFGLFALTTGIAVFFVSSPSPSIQTIVTETQKQITNLKNINVKTRLSGRQRKTKEHDIGLAPYHLELLGFSDTPRLYPTSVGHDVTLPVIVTGVTAHDYESAIELVNSVQRHLRNHTVIIYDLGLGSYELLKVKKICNTSEVCSVHLLDYEKFPRHIKENMYTHAYEPVIIQQALNEYGAVFWISADVDEYFQTDDIANILKQAESVGIAAWLLESKEPTSAYTHPGTFAHFGTKPSNYNFQHMVRASHIVLYNTRKVHVEIMKPWVGCALDLACIAPLGADYGRCVKRRPRYLYSGCHHYTESALNIVLGLAFNYEDGEYVAENFTSLFGSEATSVMHGYNTTMSTKPTPAASRLAFDDVLT